MSLLLACDVILTRLLAINTPVMKIGLDFIAVAVCAYLYGPWWAGLTAALADVLGSLIFPTGAYFPGFTLTAALTGIIFGLLVKKKPLAAAALNVILVSYFANSWMISFISGNSYSSMLKIRAVQVLVMLPLQAVILKFVLPKIMSKIS